MGRPVNVVSGQARKATSFFEGTSDRGSNVNGRRGKDKWETVGRGKDKWEKVGEGRIFGRR